MRPTFLSKCHPTDPMTDGQLRDAGSIIIATSQKPVVASRRITWRRRNQSESLGCLMEFVTEKNLAAEDE
ncbi:hypothetical protein BaRGS_00039212, partial [Batillaria attramentaria]